jgi:hypothetical protein
VDRQFVKSTHQEHIAFAWTDHELYLVSATVSIPQHKGKGGIWKANPFLCNLPSYRAGLAQHITTAMNARQYLDLQDVNTAVII